MRFGLTRVLLSFSVLSAVMAVCVPGARADDLGPQPSLCNAYAPVAGCFYGSVAGTDTFTLSDHILHIGEKVTGTYRWEIGGEGSGEMPAIGNVSVGGPGPGLKLIDCHGPRRATNAGTYMTSKASELIKGHTTCTYQAHSATDGWVSTMGLNVAAGGESFVAGDFYAVVSKGGVIEGNLREQDIEAKLPVYTGITGAKVRITGPHGYVLTSPTSDTGYYHQLVPRAGAYTVTPVLPKSYSKGSKPKMSEPLFSKVDVTENTTATADFTVPSALRLELKLNRTSVPADGMSYVTATVTATDQGEPDPGLVFSLRPYAGGSALQSAWDMKVPATICTVTGTSVGGRVWPSTASTQPNTDSVNVTTDSTGQATLAIYTGTVPGTFPLQVWAENATGHLIAGLSAVAPSEDITVTELGGSSDPTTALENYLNAPNNANVANELPTDGISITTALATAIHAGQIGDFSVAPVQTGTSSGVLITPSGARVSVDPTTGVISTASAGSIISPAGSLGASLAAGGFWGQVKTRQVGTFPSLTNWLANQAPGYAFPENAAPIKLTTGFGPLQYLGFGYGPSCT